MGKMRRNSLHSRAKMRRNVQKVTLGAQECAREALKSALGAQYLGGKKQNYINHGFRGFHGIYYNVKILESLRDAIINRFLDRLGMTRRGQGILEQVNR